MLTKFFTYLLSAYLLLLSGAGQLTARPFWGRTAFPQSQQYHKDGQANLSQIAQDVFHLKATAENSSLFPCGQMDIKEDEYGSLKKKSNDNYLPAPLFYITPSEYFHFCIDRSTSFVKKPSSVFLSFGSLNLAFCVFRIWVYFPFSGAY